MNIKIIIKGILCACISLLMSSAEAQTVVWGYNASVGQADGEFRDSFVQATATGNYSPTQWTALSISDSDGANAPGAAFWTRTTTGVSQGALNAGLYPIYSPTASNGAAIFDSDFMDNAGSFVFGSGTAPAAQRGDLISPRIDLSAFADSALTVTFHSNYRFFILNELSIRLSKDDGVTWSPPIDIRAIQATTQNNATQGRVRAHFKNFTTGGANLSQCRIKFTFAGEYYFATIDDVSIEVSPAYDMAIGLVKPRANNFVEMGDVLRMGGNAYQSYDNLDFYSFNPTNWSWGAKVVNYGSKDILPSQRPRLYCQVVEEHIPSIGSSFIVYRDSIMYMDTIFCGANNDALITKNMTIANLNDLFCCNNNTPSKYTVHYWTAHDGVEGVTSNDTTSYSFIVRDDPAVPSWAASTNMYTSKARLNPSDGRVAGTKTVFPGGGPISGFEYGSVFYFPNGATYGMTLDSVDFRYRLSSNFSGASTQTIFAYVYDYQDGSGGLANGIIESTELTMIGISAVTLTGLGTTIPPASSNLATFTSFVDAATGAPLGTLGDDKFYYIAVDVNPGLLTGVSSFGFDEVPLHQADELNYALNINNSTSAFPFAPSSVKIIDTFGVETRLTGFGGHQEVPSIGLFYSYTYINVSKLEDQANDKLWLSPNPVQDVLQIQLEQATDVQYVITDVSGRVVYYDNSTQINQEVVTVDVSHLTAGVYLVSAQTNQGVTTKKFVKK